MFLYGWNHKKKCYKVIETLVKKWQMPHLALIHTWPWLCSVWFIFFPPEPAVSTFNSEGRVKQHNPTDSSVLPQRGSIQERNCCKHRWPHSATSTETYTLLLLLLVKGRAECVLLHLSPCVTSSHYLCSETSVCQMNLKCKSHNALLNVTVDSLMAPTHQSWCKQGPRVAAAHAALDKRCHLCNDSGDRGIQRRLKGTLSAR